MTKLSISLAAAMLSITLAPAAQAYNTDPAPQTLHQITQITPVGPQSIKVDGTCSVQITPTLASILGLSGDWRSGNMHAVQTSMACANK